MPFGRPSSCLSELFASAPHSSHPLHTISLSQFHVTLSHDLMIHTIRIHSTLSQLLVTLSRCLMIAYAFITHRRINVDDVNTIFMNHNPKERYFSGIDNYEFDDDAAWDDGMLDDLASHKQHMEVEHQRRENFREFSLQVLDGDDNPVPDAPRVIRRRTALRAELQEAISHDLYAIPTPALGGPSSCF